MKDKALDFPVYKNERVSMLVPYARNSRTHSDAQISKIAASISEFGFLNPVIIDGKRGIIAGHGRVMAAKKLGLATVPVIEASHLTDEQRRAYIIADNRLALDAGWDEEMLRIEFSELGELGYDLELTGFDASELSKIFDETKGIKISDDISDDNEQLELVIKFEQRDKIEMINAISDAISEFNGATLWVSNEQI